MNVSDATLIRDGKQPPQRQRPPKKRSLVQIQLALTFSLSLSFFVHSLYSLSLSVCDYTVIFGALRNEEESGGGRAQKEET